MSARAFARLTAMLALATLAGCRDATSPAVSEADGVVFHAVTEVVGIAPVGLRTRIQATNTTADTVRLFYGLCNVIQQAFRRSDRSGSAAWDAAGLGQGCIDLGVETKLAPGETAWPRYLESWRSVPEILGDSLPAGRYYFAALVQVNSLVVRISAGEAQLVKEQAALPSSRSLAGVRYQVRVQPARGYGDSLRVLVVAANEDTTTAVFQGSPSLDCPISLAVFGTARERDFYYLQQEVHPAWWPSGCPVRIPATSLAPGESRTFEGRIGPPPSGDPLFFVAWLSLHIPGASASWLDTERRLDFAAGDIAWTVQAAP